MRHMKGYNKLGRESSHRRAMLRNLATSLVEEERITTTVAKAKALRRIVEKLVTKGRAGDLHSRRQIGGYLLKDSAAKKLCSELSPRFKDRPGGYTRIIKTGFRQGDGAEMAMIEFVDYIGGTQSAES